jgi:hypothetical protein
MHADRKFPPVRAWAGSRAGGLTVASRGPVRTGQADGEVAAVAQQLLRILAEMLMLGSAARMDRR